MSKYRTEEEQLAVVKQEGYAIQYINNPSEEVQLAAVKQNGNAIQFIKNPSEVVSIGDIIKVQVIGIDKEKQKVKLSMKIKN